jgi:hypothetical protein
MEQTCEVSLMLLSRQPVPRLVFQCAVVVHLAQCVSALDVQPRSKASLLQCIGTLMPTSVICRIMRASTGIKQRL